MSAVITIILWLLIVGVLWWGAQEIIKVIPMPNPIRTVIYVIVTVLLVIVLLSVVVQALGLLGIHVTLPMIGR